MMASVAAAAGLLPPTLRPRPEAWLILVSEPHFPCGRLVVLDAAGPVHRSETGPPPPACHAAAWSWRMGPTGPWEDRERSPKDVRMETHPHSIFSASLGPGIPWGWPWRRGCSI